jgi:VIT1/CCC1 family predicted Fe2+/Mn2+ transporter
MVDYVTGKILSALSKGCTEAVNIAVHESKLPEQLKKFASKSLTNVDEMIEETLVLNNMSEKFEEVKPKPIEAVKRTEAEKVTQSEKEIKTDPVEERPIKGRY